MGICKLKNIQVAASVRRILVGLRVILMCFVVNLAPFSPLCCCFQIMIFLFLMTVFFSLAFPLLFCE